MAALTANAKVSLPQLFSDGMVLQRNQPLPVWGWAAAGESITVRLGKATATTVADDQGCWRVDLPKMKAAGPLVLTVNDVTVSDVWVGDVWMCSGQSNIDTHLERVYPQYPDEIDNDVNPMVRLFQVANVPNTHGPQKDVRATGWKTLSKENGWHFTAIGYFLGKRMFRETGVAQGIIQSSWGGTPIEAWLPTDSMQKYNPKAVAETRLLQDEKVVRAAMSFNNIMSARWEQMLNETDPGILEQWTSADYDDRSWAEANQYQLPISGRQFCGTYWLRQHIKVDAAHAGKAALMRVGTLFDADQTYVNGKQVGSTGYQYPPRRYQIPEGLLREGDNVITVRFINKNGKPQFSREKPYRIEYSRSDHQPLSETWRVHDGVQMPSSPSVPMSLQNNASTLWNGMLYGLAPYALSGIVWYQGESNTGRPAEYEPLLGCLMHSWRQLFQQPQLPFAVVQLANYMAPSVGPQNSNWARLRESQHRAVLADPRAGLAVAIDLGEAVDIHPLLKKDVAERCALVFDRLVFGKKVLLSPEATAVKLVGNEVQITFDQPLQEGLCKGFELAGVDGKFRSVDAQVKGQVATLPAFQGACTVRYAWKDNPVEANLRASKTQLPAVPFERNF